MNRFRKRDKPAGKKLRGPDSSGEGKRDIPLWMKLIIYVHIDMTYSIVIMHRLTIVPFSLSEVILGILIVSGLGSSVGMVYKRVAEIIGILPQIKAAV